MQLPGESADDLLRDDRIGALLAPFVNGADVEIERKTVYAFHARVADRWRNGQNLPRRRRRPHDAAFRRPGHERRHEGRGQSVVETGRGPCRKRASRTFSTPTKRNARTIVRAMVKLSRRLGAVIMPTNPAIARLRDAAFACLNLSSGVRSFIRRGGLLPPPHISRSALTASGKDKLIGQMMPQPDVSSAQGRAPLDQHLACHQWLALGVGVDPASAMSERDLSILDALGARFICLNGKASERPNAVSAMRRPRLRRLGEASRASKAFWFGRTGSSRNGCTRARDLQVLAHFAPARAPAPSARRSPATLNRRKLMSQAAETQRRPRRNRAAAQPGAAGQGERTRVRSLRASRPRSGRTLSARFRPHRRIAQQRQPVPARDGIAAVFLSRHARPQCPVPRPRSFGSVPGGPPETVEGLWPAGRTVRRSGRRIGGSPARSSRRGGRRHARLRAQRTAAAAARQSGTTRQTMSFESTIPSVPRWSRRR